MTHFKDLTVSLICSEFEGQVVTAELVLRHFLDQAPYYPVVWEHFIHYYRALHKIVQAMIFL